ncbi:MAG TPA: acyl-CoA dehydrogenase family protein, partial [Candidatus Angelobacter sp.]|nr:acyl-CoA dehydrogenase family protein [Candidatus Angelobacter sp.]
VAKFWLCKRVPVQVGEALECLGGNGYVEESIMPRLYREAPLYSIWEGSGNVMCLDILRAITKEPATLDVFTAELRLAKGADRRFDDFLARLDLALARQAKSGENGAGGAEGQARVLAEKMALALEASLVLRHGSPAVAEAFCAARLTAESGRIFGTLSAGTDVKAVLEETGGF